ncbi:4Fe-4S dicluster domain-containing protein [bacterium]|nr:4Fe-4S dicluster domain-containing protein [bacterium]
MKAMLIDSTRCIGCRGCQIACKQWNELPAEQTTFFASKGYQNPRDLSSKTWTVITYNEVQIQDRFEWVFGKLQCFHCNIPACATACPVGALWKTEEGPVAYDANICLGCRYCQLACPFLVPRFEWDRIFPKIMKCTMCDDRVVAGLEPACSKVCPTDAIIFGDREVLVAEAENRISLNPRGYVHHIYGKDEVGGTCVMHLSNVPFEELAYQTNLPQKAFANLPAKTPADYSKPAMHAIPFVLTGLGIALGAVSWVVNRRMENERNTQSKEGAK